MARSYLCSRHQPEAGKATPQQLAQTIAECCAKVAGFLSPRMTVMETIFRLLLAGGNQPVPSEEIAQQLSQLRSENVYPHTVEQVLSQEPRFYGIRGLAEEDVEGLAETDTVAAVEVAELDTGTEVGAETD